MLSAQYVKAEQQNLHDARADGARIHVADRAAELVSEHHQHERRRYQLRDGAGGGNHAGRQAHVVAITHHDGQGDHPHRDDRRGDGAGNRPENRADDNYRVGETAAHRAEQLAHAVEHVLGEPAAFEDRAHEGEERDGEQQIVRNDAEYALGQRLQQLDMEKAEFDPPEAEKEADGGQRECDRVTDQHEYDEAPEHQRRHQFTGHCNGLS